MTLKEYLEKQIRHFAKAKQEAKVDDPLSDVFEGRIRAYTDILLTCSDSVLNKKITDEVW
jgi:hypothetical protein